MPGLAGENSSDDKTAGPAPGQGLPQGGQALRRNRDQQAAGGLRVEAQVHRRLVHTRRQVQRVGDVFAVAFNRAGNHALPQGV